MDKQIAEFHARLAALGRRGPGQRYPDDLRMQAVGLANALLASGMSRYAISKKLGVRSDTLRRWCGASSKPRAVEPVVIAPASAPVRPRATAGNGIAVTSPDGWRIDGLSVAGAAELLGRLR